MSLRKMPDFSVIITGSGTSHGVPVPGCRCDVCRSSDEKDKRTRAACIVKSPQVTLAIDTGPEFRLQCIAADVNHLDAVLLTHAHADHIFGLDDTRIFSFKKPIPVYGNSSTLKTLKKIFSYAFNNSQIGGGKPKFSPRLCDAPFTLGDLTVVPVPMYHGKLETTGFRVGNFAYLTDLNNLPATSLDLLHGVEFLVIDGLRVNSHVTHFNFDEAMEAGAKIAPKQLYITHITHDNSHAGICAYLKEKKKLYPAIGSAQPAYDGLILHCSC